MAVLDARIRSRALEAAKALQREGAVRAVYIFGSQVEGRADEWSDIDVAAFMTGIESWDLWHRAEVIARIQKAVGFDVEPHLFSAASLDNPPSASFAAHILKHGIRIL